MSPDQGAEQRVYIVAGFRRNLTISPLNICLHPLFDLSLRAFILLPDKRPGQNSWDISISVSHPQDLIPLREGQNKPLGQSSGSHMWPKSPLACSSPIPNEEERPVNLCPTKSRAENQSQALGLARHWQQHQAKAASSRNLPAELPRFFWA